MHSPSLLASAALVALAGSSAADLQPEWIATLPMGATLGAGPQGFAVDAAGVSYVSGNGGSSSNNDIVTAAFGPDGTKLWESTFDGPEHWHDQVRDLALSPDGATLWISGNTPDPQKYANVLLVQYDAATGAELQVVDFTTGPFSSEDGQTLAVGAQGDVYVAGGTVGDGSDVLVMKFDAAGGLIWSRKWDGAAFGPFSQDHAQEIEIAPDGNPVVMIDGVAASQHADYVVVKYDAATGATIWETSWGKSGSDFPEDMEIDAAGDVYVTGSALDSTYKFGTIKLRGADGALLWEAYDSAAFDDHAYALALDGQGGVVVTGAVDPDGDHSNFNDDFYTVRRDAATGAQLWTHRYGAPCVGCYDVPSDVAVDSAGDVFVAGSTSSPPYAGDLITFVLDLATGLEADRLVLDNQPGYHAGTGALAFDAAENLFNGGRSYDADTGAVAGTVMRTTSFAQTFFHLEAAPFQAGAPAPLATADGAPGATQWFVYGLAGTASIPLAPLGVTLGVASPLLLFSAPADGSGGVSASPVVPPSTAGVTVWMQAVGFGEATPIVKRTIF